MRRAGASHGCCRFLRAAAAALAACAVVFGAAPALAGDQPPPPGSLPLTGWIDGLPTNTTREGFVLPLTLDRAVTGWVCNAGDPTRGPLVLEVRCNDTLVGTVTASGLFFNDARQGEMHAHGARSGGGGRPPVPGAPPTLVDTVNASGLFFNDAHGARGGGGGGRPPVPGAPPLLRCGFIFFFPEAALDGRNATLRLTAVDPRTGASAPFAPGLAASAGTLEVSLLPRLSPRAPPALGSTCLGPRPTCPSRGDALSFGRPWFDEPPAGWTDTALPEGNLFRLWNCSSSREIDTIVRLPILPYARRPGAPAGAPGDRYHHRGFKKDSLHVSEAEVAEHGGGPVIHFSAAREGVPGAPGRAMGLGARVASVWGLKKAAFNNAANRWEVFDQLDSPTSGYGVSSLDGVDGVNMIVNDGGAVGWGPTATIAPHDPRCRIPSLAGASVSDLVPSYPLVGDGPLGLSTVRDYLPPGGADGHASGVASRCVHMNPKLSEFAPDGTPGALWAYLWAGQPAEGCVLPTGQHIEPGYYRYAVDPRNASTGWQLDLAAGKAAANQTRGQAMKKEWGRQFQTSFVYSCWDLPPLDAAPSTVFRVDTAAPPPRGMGEPLLSCYGGAAEGRVHLGEATGNSTDLFFLVDTDAQVRAADAVGETFAADIFYAFSSALRGVPPAWARPAASGGGGGGGGGE